jgi:uncharacterized protein YqgQ
MKRIKRIFYPIYFVVVFIVLMISFNIYDSLELFKEWGWFRYFSDLPYMVRDLMVFLCVLMMVELVLENIHLSSKKSKISDLEQEVLNLKAKLYDKKENESPVAVTESNEDDDYIAEDQ